ncbi:MAG TPA: 50S ribosomal protein L9 [Cytophagaceae bacterium]|jgi:large subunit ribosomal protein L9|nr:50S ribosomal protein L9 [Cytophagaceae bacterium]
MEIILKEDIKGLGYKNDVVKVKPGYGRNYLIPKGLASMATESAKKVVAENVKQAAHKAEKMKNDALSIAEKLAGVTIEVKAKVGDSGKIFGAVTSLQISDTLKDKGFAIDRKKISFKGDVKEVGEYTAVVDLHKEVKQEIKFKVVAE